MDGVVDDEDEDEFGERQTQSSEICTTHEEVSAMCVQKVLYQNIEESVQFLKQPKNMTLSRNGKCGVPPDVFFQFED